VKFDSAPDPALVDATLGAHVVEHRQAIRIEPILGITLPGKHPGPPVVTLQAPVDSGSLMNINRPLTSKVCEKSPARSRAVGIR